MLCPKCGVEVGETAALCAKCAASASGTALGRISPKQIAVQMTPEEREAYERSKADYYSGKSSTHRPGMVLEKPQPSKLFGTLLVITLVLITLGWAYYLLADETLKLPAALSGWLQEDEEESAPVDRFAHIRLGSGITQSERDPSAIGEYTVGQTRQQLRSARCRMGSDGHSLIVEFFAERELQPQDSPQVQVTFRFPPQTKQIFIKDLLGYSVAVSWEDKVLHFNREFSRQLITPMGEVHELFGLLAVGQNVRGALSDTRTKAVGAKTLQVRWNLSFDQVIL